MKNQDNLTRQNAAAQCSFVVLAGGLSSRMQTDKRALSYAGHSFLDNALQHGLAFPRRYLSVAEEGYAQPGYTVVPDAVARCGPIGGMLSVLREIRTPLVFFVPCDMPLLPARVFDLLLLNFTKESDYAVFAQNGLPFPFPVLLRTQKALPVLEAAVCAKRFSFYKALSATLQGRQLSIESTPGLRPEFFQNINTRSDYQSLLYSLAASQ